MKIALGLEVFLAEKLELVAGKRVGLICNPTTVNHNFLHAADLFHLNPEINLTALFGPQHGIRGETQDNMIEWESFQDRRTAVMSFSLYGKVRQPTPEMLDNVDVLVFDIQDVGTRVYTFNYTMTLAMIAAKRDGKQMVVLDRPNPIGGHWVEGSLLEPGWESFVGMFPIPMRHGMTVGELARLFNDQFGIGCDLTVIPMRGYDRSMWFEQTDAPWVIPSPNMPTPDTAVVYPGTVYIEGTKVSEGRGTTRPFEINGAPYVDSHQLAEALNSSGLSGVYFRPHSFQPTFQKYKGELCHGVQIHVFDRHVFRPVITGIALIKTVHDLYREFAWQDPPYEYVYDKCPFDVIAGTGRLRSQIESGVSIAEIAESWRSDEESFIEMRRDYLLY
jgi:uncharacterized protein YbbC (DUF1343 family)